MNRKAQVTLIIIIGIVLITAIAVGYSLYNSALKKPSVERAIEIPLEAQPIQNYVDTCFRQTAVGGVYVLGIQGGRIYLNDFVRTDFSEINYAFVVDEVTLQ